MTTETKDILARIIAETPPAVRIAHIWGHGEWHHEADLPHLKAVVTRFNREYGTGTHWIERSGE